MKKTMLTLCSVAVLGTILYAGGNKNVVPTDAPVAPLESTPVATTAVSPFYVGVGASIDSVNTFVYDAETVSSATLRVGYDFMTYLGAEARGSYGMTTGDNLAHTYSYGLYLKPQYPINDTWKLYGLAGYAQTQITLDEAKAKATHVKEDTTQNGVSFGVGVAYALNNNWGLFADAMRLIDESEKKPEGEYAAKVDSFTFGGVFRF